VELTAIKVKIGLQNKDGRLEHAYPNFNSIAPALRQSMDWSLFIDLFGGWKYDKVAGHQEDDVAGGSPRGVWFGLLLVPADFATEAVALFPGEVSKLSGVDATTFYESRVTVNQPEIWWYWSRHSNL
jgi:hypothetical protein